MGASKRAVTHQLTNRYILMKQVIQYQANDGTVFSTAHACELYEMLGSDTMEVTGHEVRTVHVAGELNRHNISVVNTNVLDELKDALATFSGGPVCNSLTNTEVVNAVVNILQDLDMQLHDLKTLLSKKSASWLTTDNSAVITAIKIDLAERII